jgi:hypothetical protein
MFFTQIFIQQKMKNLFIITTLFCALVLTITSHAKLINFGESESGRIIHVDYERINNYRFSNKIIET